MPAPNRHALLLHGAGGGGWEWNVWRGVFAAHGIACAMPDLQPAAAGLGSTTFADYARQARLVLESLPQPRFAIGASLGGLLAMTCADAADALVLVNPIPPSPWSRHMPARDWPTIVPWRRDARLASTLRAMPDADGASALFAFRRWRDESGEVLRCAHAGVEVTRPVCPVLCVTSEQDDDVPPALTRTLAAEWKADLLETASISHVGPLLGTGAARVAEQVVTWLSAK